MWADVAKKAKDKPNPPPAAVQKKPANGATAQAASAAAVQQKRLSKCQATVGYHVELKIGDTVLRGIVYAAHDTFLVLQESSGLRLININALSEPPKKLQDADGKHSPKKITDLEVVSEIDEHTRETLRNKFNDAKAKRQQMLANRNPNASAWAQKIFDDLQKTFAPSWEGTTICIEQLGLKIAPPYTVDHIEGNQERAVARVKNILQQMHDAKAFAAKETAQ